MFQVDYTNDKENQLFQKYRRATNSAKLFLILIRHGEIKLFSDGKETTEVTAIQIDVS